MLEIGCYCGIILKEHTSFACSFCFGYQEAVAKIQDEAELSTPPSSSLTSPDLVPDSLVPAHATPSTGAASSGNSSATPKSQKTLLAACITTKRKRSVCLLKTCCCCLFVCLFVFVCVILFCSFLELIGISLVCTRLHTDYGSPEIPPPPNFFFTLTEIFYERIMINTSMKNYSLITLLLVSFKMANNSLKS